MAQAAELVTARECGSCTLCCKLLGIPELEKPRLEWCGHCNTSKGCKIYNDRPGRCRDFYCGYITNPTLSEAWKPSKSKLMLTVESNGDRIMVHVDPARPDAWQKEPFYSTMKKWALAPGAQPGQVIVWIGRRIIAILPDQDKDLGDVREDQFIMTSQKQTPMGPVYDVFAVDYDDPRAAKLREREENKLG
jgi:hypothetical protein